MGACFAALCLVSGSLWGKPMWGAWWVWDARLTSMLVLFFLYLGHIALVRAFDDPARGYRAGAILALIGVVDLPIIHFSVVWWNTLHQGNSLGLFSAPTIYISMLWPLLVTALGYSLGLHRDRPRPAPRRRDRAAAHRAAHGTGERRDGRDESIPSSSPPMPPAFSCRRCWRSPPGLRLRRAERRLAAVDPRGRQGRRGAR